MSAPLAGWPFAHERGQTTRDQQGAKEGGREGERERQTDRERERERLTALGPIETARTSLAMPFSFMRA